MNAWGPFADSPRAVLVTGASTGIGRDIADTLARRGHAVYAGARRDEDLQALAAVTRVTPVRLDVRDAGDVDEARRRVAADGGLFGLVNNAGIGGLGPLASWGDDDLRDIFDVNVFGPHRVTNALLPMIVAGRGRVVNIGSQGGSISAADAGPYAMTKHALEAYTIALAEELRPFGARASIVQPGAVVSAIGTTALPGMLARLARAPEPFRAHAAALAARLQHPPAVDPDAPESDDNRKPSPPALVTDAVLHALFADEPRTRYLVGTPWEGERVLSMLVERLLDAARAPQHGLGRDDLVALLDAHAERGAGGAPTR